MITRSMARCAAAAALLLVAAPAPAQEVTADLRSRLTPGAEHRFAMTIDTLLHLRAPQGSDRPTPEKGLEEGKAAPPAEQKQSARQWVDFIVRVRDAGEQGSTIELEYAGLRFSLESPNQSGSFDSAAPGSPDDPAQALRPVVGTRLLVTVDAEGNVTGVAGGDRLAAAGESDAGGAFWPRIAAQFRERAIVASFVEPILTTRHPTGTATVGETWAYRDRLEESPLGAFTIVTNYRLDAVGTGTATIALTGSIAAGTPAGEGEPPFELLDSTNTGREVWSTAEGILDSLEQTQSVHLRTSMQGVKMDLLNSTTVRLTRTGAP